MMTEETFGYSTKCVHAGTEPDPTWGSLVTPIHQTTTFAMSTVEALLDWYQKKKTKREVAYTYTSTGNPTQRAAERKIALLEGGEDAKVFSSGMAAITTTMTSLVSAGDEIIVPQDLYGETYLFFTEVLAKMGIKTHFVDSIYIEQAEQLITDRTRVFYFETPSNPTLKLTDISKGAQIAKAHNITTVIDNTFASPYNQNPLNLGMDIVIHSGTKYLSGHHNVVCGVAVSNKEHINAIRHIRSIYGGILDPFAAFLLIMGMQTMALRVERQNHNALMLARFLEAHPRIQKVNYPGLETHPQHTLAKKQMRGFGGMLSFEVKGGLEAVTNLINHFKLVRLATSLGGVDTIATIPTLTTHGDLSREEQEQMGITPSLIRISVGIEDINDLKRDFEHALNFV
ncbi:MAG: trans-sulfuration enzyme family protein [Candidatus Heimdallarchaeota archaeon]